MFLGYFKKGDKNDWGMRHERSSRRIQKYLETNGIKPKQFHKKNLFLTNGIHKNIVFFYMMVSQSSRVLARTGPS